MVAHQNAIKNASLWVTNKELVVEGSLLLFTFVVASPRLNIKMILSFLVLLISNQDDSQLYE